MNIKWLLFCLLFCLPAVAEDSPIPVRVPSVLREKLKSFEPSCAVYVPEINKYIVGIDDTTKNEDPWMFLMNINGEVDKVPVLIDGVEKMTDIESISLGDDGSVYLLSSMSLNKSGKNKPERNLFVKTRPGSRSLKIGQGVELRPLVLEALLHSEDPILKKMRDKFEPLLEVESHFIKDGELYIGLKDPQVAPNQALVLNIGPVEEIFAGNVTANVWHVLNLDAHDGVINRLSDLAWIGDDLLATSTSDERIGHLWLVGKQMKRLKDFEGVHPEGIASTGKGRALLLFDQGNDGDGLYQYFFSSRTKARKARR